MGPLAEKRGEVTGERASESLERRRTKAQTAGAAEAEAIAGRSSSQTNEICRSHGRFAMDLGSPMEMFYAFFGLGFQVAEPEDKRETQASVKESAILFAKDEFSEEKNTEQVVYTEMLERAACEKGAHPYKRVLNKGSAGAGKS